MNKNMPEEKKYEKQNIKAIIGLGNTGPAYYKTRHSIGFRVIDELARTLNASWSTSGDQQVAQAKLSLDPYDQKAPSVHLVKSLGFMNNSGHVLSYLLKKGIKPENILVIHDELEKKFGKTNIRFGGGARGHNGLRSIMGVIGGDFWRLSFGIDRPAEKSDVGNYVLRTFTPEEERALDTLITQAVTLILN
ncbi:MAG: aminoacyl-tRNA hydrolase [bacterium]